MYNRPVNTRRARLRDQDAQLYRLANPELVTYLEQKAQTQYGGFAQKMLDAIAQWGGLTEGQKAAVERMRVQDAERAARPPVASVAVNAAKIQEAFDRAISGANADGEGIKWLRLKADTFTFSPAKANSRNPGAIYVKEDQAYLGKIVNGSFHPVRECTNEQASRIACVAADPAEAARQYGLRTKQCGICGRELTNPESRARGIGPICAERMGF